MEEEHSSVAVVEERTTSKGLTGEDEVRVEGPTSSMRRDMSLYIIGLCLAFGSDLA